MEHNRNIEMMKTKIKNNLFTNDEIVEEKAEETNSKIIKKRKKQSIKGTVYMQ